MIFIKEKSLNKIWRNAVKELMENYFLICMQEHVTYIINF